MITQSEIAAGTARIVGGKVKGDDQETLLAVYRIYLKNRFNLFPDLAERLAAAEDTASGKTASKLAAILILLEENGFDLSELGGSKTALQTNEVDSLNLKIKFGLTILGYSLPEEFTGGIENGDEIMLGNMVSIGSYTIERKAGW